MNADVENEAKLQITNGIEKASSSTGVDIKVSLTEQLTFLTTRLFLSIASLQTSQRADGQTIWTLIPLCHGRGL